MYVNGNDILGERRMFWAGALSPVFLYHSVHFCFFVLTPISNDYTLCMVEFAFLRCIVK